MLNFISYPIGKILYFIYNTVAFKNYGLSIVLLTVAIKSILFPLTIKQYRSTSMLSEMQPVMQDLQKKYKNDPTKLNEETMKLYKENNINPAAGCLPLLIQMPILFSLYYVISQPLKYMFGISSSVIQKLFEMIPAGSERISNLHDLTIINYFTKHTDKLSDLSSLITKKHLLNMNFFGINLGSVPSLDHNKLFASSSNVQSFLILLIPVLSVLTTYISMKYSMQQSPQASSNQAQNSMQKNMALISPLMTGFISFTVPAGLGIYWITSNLLQIGQQLFLNKFIIKKSNNPKRSVIKKAPA